MVNLLTALIIQGNEVDIYPYQDRDSKKWGFEIARMERGNYRGLVTCSAVYDNQEVAKFEGEKYVKSVREMDLTDKVEGIGVLLGESAEVVQAVIETADTLTKS